MDPITAAIIASVASGATKVGEQLITDAYNELKKLLEKKFGTRSKVVKAVKELEANPESKAQKMLVEERVAEVNAARDQELVQAAQALLKAVKAKPGGGQIVQNAVGDGIIQVSGDENIISVNTPRKQ